MRFKQFFSGVGAALAISVAGAGQAAVITVNLGPSAETFTQYGFGADFTGRGTFREGQGASTFDGVRSTFVLSGVIASGNTPGLNSGTYEFVTSYDGADTPFAGPNAPRGRTNAINPAQFNYYFLHPSTQIDLILHTPTGNFVQDLFSGGAFHGGFSFVFASSSCTGLVGPCSQNAVGLTPGSTISGPVRIFANFDSAALNPVPEPATWALMIMGFGGAGAVLRRRRAVAA